MKILVGSTGFVGGNLQKQTTFDAVYHSTDVHKAYGTAPDLLVYCGVRAEKYIANQKPEYDLRHIEETMKNIHSIGPKRIILISTIDVYPSPSGVDESSEIPSSVDEAYGRNRRLLESWVSENYKDHHVVRLPALFGDGLKKNFIYDLLNPVPSKLSKGLYDRFSEMSEAIAAGYTQDQTGFFIRTGDTSHLKPAFEKVGFSAIHFTDCRSVFQFYNLQNLWKHLEIIMENELKLVNITAEPLSAAEVYHAIYGKPYKHQTGKTPYYDVRSKYAHLFGGANGYMHTGNNIIESIAQFLRRSQ